MAETKNQKAPTQEVEVRRAPKYLPFLLTGGAAGLVLGLLGYFLTGQQNTTDASSMLGISVLFPSGILAFAGIIAAWILDRKSVAAAKHTTATKLEL